MHHHVLFGFTSLVSLGSLYPFLTISIPDVYNVPLTGLYAVFKLSSIGVTVALAVVVVSVSHDYWIYLDSHYSLRAVWHITESL